MLRSPETSSSRTSRMSRLDDEDDDTDDDDEDDDDDDNDDDASCHYRNRDHCQVVEYQYKPEYLARFNAGEREKMEKRQTGVIAQVAHRHRRRRCRHSQQQQHHH